MKITALRSIGKINSDVLQNSCRLFSFKFEMTPASRVSSDLEEAKPVPEDPKSVNFRYNVCQPRTSPVERPNMAGDIVAVQKQNVKAAIEEQQLQPAMLPEYFQKQMEKNVLINPEPDPNEGDRINNGHNPIQKRFQVSKTYANAILPLKSVKLANPFPEPVKMMMSRTVSDDEKAEQMLAESKSQRNMSDWGGRPASSTFRSFSTDVKRWYSKSVSSNPDKCKKIGKDTKKGCPKMKVAGCPPPARTKCDRLAKKIDCKKQDAPYPAYSEFCHEEIDEKPSSCKMCPWKSEDNPNFKPQKKKLHTASHPMRIRRSGLEMDFTERAPEEAEPPIEAEAEPEGMQCDLRKPGCERPKNRRCPPPKGEKKKEDPKKKKDKKKTDSITNILDDGVILPGENVRDLLSLRKSKDEQPHGHGHCKIKKFKFPKCNQPIKRDSQVDTGRCPPKKKKPKIRDCPPDEDKGCGPAEKELEELCLSGGDKGESKDRKCPKIDLTIFKEEPVDEDPCKLKRKGTTKICPADLLKKKRKKPRKKTSGIVTPVDSKVEPPQPGRTI